MSAAPTELSLPIQIGLDVLAAALARSDGPAFLLGGAPDLAVAAAAWFGDDRILIAPPSRENVKLSFPLPLGEGHGEGVPRAPADYLSRDPGSTLNRPPATLTPMRVLCLFPTTTSALEAAARLPPGGRIGILTRGPLSPLFDRLRAQPSPRIPQPSTISPQPPASINHQPSIINPVALRAAGLLTHGRLSQLVDRLRAQPARRVPQPSTLSPQPPASINHQPSTINPAALRAAGLTLELRWGIGRPSTPAWAALTRLADRGGRPDLADRLDFAYRRSLAPHSGGLADLVALVARRPS